MSLVVSTVRLAVDGHGAGIVEFGAVIGEVAFTVGLTLTLGPCRIFAFVISLLVVAPAQVVDEALVLFDVVEGCAFKT